MSEQAPLPATQEAPPDLSAEIRHSDAEATNQQILRAATRLGALSIGSSEDYSESDLPFDQRKNVAYRTDISDNSKHALFAADTPSGLYNGNVVKIAYEKDENGELKATSVDSGTKYVETNDGDVLDFTVKRKVVQTAGESGAHIREGGRVVRDNKVVEKPDSVLAELTVEQARSKAAAQLLKARKAVHAARGAKKAKQAQAINDTLNQAA